MVKNETGEEVSTHSTPRKTKNVNECNYINLLSSFFFQVLIPLNPSGVKVQENSALPDYLPEEEESPERETDRAISRTTAKEDSSGSWLNAAASFLTKTFYW